MIAVAFVASAALGAVARFAAARRWNRPDLPLGTLAVNVAGAFALGLLADRSPDVVVIVGTGGLGALTTFSALAVETERLGRRGIGYLSTTVVLGVGAAWAGLQLA